MSDKLTTVVETVTEIQKDASLLLGLFGVAIPAEAKLGVTAAAVLAGMVTKAIAAYKAASGIEITPESIAALMPNPVPLTQPDAVSN